MLKKIISFIKSVIDFVKKILIITLICTLTFAGYNFYHTKYKLNNAINTEIPSISKEETPNTNLSQMLYEEIYTEVKKLKQHHEIEEANLEIIKNKVSSVQEDMKEIKDARHSCPLQIEHEKITILGFRIIKNVGYTSDLSYEIKDLYHIIQKNLNLKKCFLFDSSNLATFDNIVKFTEASKQITKDKYINKTVGIADKVLNLIKYTTRNMDKETNSKIFKIETLKQKAILKDMNEICKYYFQNPETIYTEEHKNKLSNTCQAYYLDSCLIQFVK